MKPRQPEHDQIGAENVRDIDAAEGPLDGVFAALRIVAGVSAVDRHGAEPKARGDHFSGNAGIAEALFQFFGFTLDLWPFFILDVRHGVVVVEHHGVEAEFLQLVELPIEGLFRTRDRSIWVGTLADVPRAEAKFVALFLRHKSSG